MRFTFDEQFLLDCFREIVQTPSPVGYPVLLNPVLERYAAMFGQTVRTVDADGMERTHMEGLRSMMNLLLSYVLDI